MALQQMAWKQIWRVIQEAEAGAGWSFRKEDGSEDMLRSRREKFPSR